MVERDEDLRQAEQQEAMMRDIDTVEEFTSIAKGVETWADLAVYFRMSPRDFASIIGRVKEEAYRFVTGDEDPPLTDDEYCPPFIR